MRDLTSTNPLLLTEQVNTAGFSLPHRGKGSVEKDVNGILPRRGNGSRISD